MGRLTAQEHGWRSLSEAQWQQMVTDIAGWCGWRWYWSPANRPVNGHVQNIKAGFPDLCLVRGPRLVFAELKRETGKTTAEQDAWLAALTAASAETYLWKPSDIDEVKAVLR